MKYQLIISYEGGQYILWNKMANPEWEITFAYEEQMFKFLERLLENTDV